MRKIILLLVTILLIFFIYNSFNNKKINYVFIGDNGVFNNYLSDYFKKNESCKEFNNLFHNKSISGLTKNIRENKTIRINNNDYYIKKVLRESDILVISVGIVDLFNNYDKSDINKNYTYFNKMYNEIENLLYEVKKYTRGKIIFLGYYNPTNYYDSKIDELFFDFDYRLNNLMKKDIIYISLYEIVKGNKYKNNNSIYLNTDGNKKIASIIEFYI